MKKSKTSRSKSPFTPRDPEEAHAALAPRLHRIGKKTRPGRSRLCGTDMRGYATPRNKSPLELVVNVNQGFVPLWQKGVVLNWRFNEDSLGYFQNVAAARNEIELLLGEAVAAWGAAAPVRFAKSADRWDFEIVVRDADRCDPNGCVLASAFFPDAGRHELRLYPKLFEQSAREQVETLVHEIGHTFGLRHFFAELSEADSPFVKFGKHDPFSIMNYGEKSRLTPTDRSDLRKLYAEAWAGTLTEINGTAVKLVRPYHEL